MTDELMVFSVINMEPMCSLPNREWVLHQESELSVRLLCTLRDLDSGEQCYLIIYLIFSEDNLRKGTEYTPWYSGQNKFASQKGTGGFLKVRDVLPHTVVSFFSLFIHFIKQFSGWKRNWWREETTLRGHCSTTIWHQSSSFTKGNDQFRNAKKHDASTGMEEGMVCRFIQNNKY